MINNYLKMFKTSLFTKEMTLKPQRDIATGPPERL